VLFFVRRFLFGDIAQAEGIVLARYRSRFLFLADEVAKAEAVGIGLVLFVIVLCRDEGVAHER
jgi:hypothetical protein